MLGVAHMIRRSSVVGLGSLHLGRKTMTEHYGGCVTHCDLHQASLELVLVAKAGVFAG